MFFLKNIFILFYIGFKKNNFLNVSFKKRYKLYLFFKKHEVYFSRFFNILNIKGLTPFLYVTFVQFFLKKNFDNSKFRSWVDWVSDENLLFCVVYFLNKIFRVNLNTSTSIISSNNHWDDVKKNFSNVNNLKNYWIFNFFKSNTSSTGNSDLQKKSDNYRVNYSGTSLGKYINNNSLEGMSVYFLRKTRTFNKGRYSRNRQNYRTGVYWCLYINIMVLFGLYFYFYRFTLNFGYLWWLFFSLVASFFVPRMVKFRLYDPRVFFQTLSLSQPLIFRIIDLKLTKKWF